MEYTVAVDVDILKENMRINGRKLHDHMICQSDTWLRRLLHQMVHNADIEELLPQFKKHLLVHRPPLLLLIDRLKGNLSNIPDSTTISLDQIDEWCRTVFHRKIVHLNQKELVEMIVELVNSGVKVGYVDDGLPDVLWNKIFSYLDAIEIIPMRFLNRNFYDRISNPDLWYSMEKMTFHLSLFSRLFIRKDNLHLSGFLKECRWLNLNNVKEVNIVDDLTCQYLNRGKDDFTFSRVRSLNQVEQEAIVSFKKVLSLIPSLEVLKANDFIWFNNDFILDLIKLAPKLKVLSIGTEKCCSFLSPLENSSLVKLSGLKRLEVLELGGSTNSLTNEGVSIFVLKCSPTLRVFKLFQNPSVLRNCLYPEDSFLDLESLVQGNGSNTRLSDFHLVVGQNQISLEGDLDNEELVEYGHMLVRPELREISNRISHFETFSFSCLCTYKNNTH